MNHLNQKVHALKIQIEEEKRLIKNGKGRQIRLDGLNKELNQCLKRII